MKRVLLTVHKFFPMHRAGTEVLTLKVAQELKCRGWQVLIVTANPPDSDARHSGGNLTSDFEYEGLPVHVIEEALRLKDYSFKHEYYHPAIKEHFVNILREFKPDLLHIFHAQNHSASIIEAAGEACLPVVCSATDFWFICPVVQLKRPNGAVCRGPEAGALNCLTCYTPELFAPVEEFAEAVEKKLPLLNSLPRPAKEFLARSMYVPYMASKLPSAIQATVERPGVLRKFANETRAIMVPTKLMRELFIENGIKAELIHHVPFGIDVGPFANFQEKTMSDKLRIGFIGTLSHHKGVDLLLDAFQSLPTTLPAVLKIYGDLNQFPAYGKQLLEQARKDFVRDGKIEFNGTFPNHQFGEILTGIDVLVVPSRWYENTPLVLQSALAAKTPLVVTDLGGLSELVTHDGNGLVFPLNNVKALADQLLRLITEPGLCQRLRSNIVPERTICEMVDDIESIYAQSMQVPVTGNSVESAISGVSVK